MKTSLKILSGIFITVIANAAFAVDLACDQYTSIEIPNTDITYATAINNNGVVIGNFIKDSQQYNPQGFIRTVDGNISIISLDHAAKTEALAINDSGIIAGYANINDENHGFIRDINGKITLIDVPSSDGTVAIGINNNGDITGHASKSDDFILQGFIRNAKGKVTIFTVSKAGYTLPSKINDKGIIIGCYAENYSPLTSCNYDGHGFVRMANGKIIKFDVPSAILTFPTSITEDGVISGYYSYGGDKHGFIRDQKGNITKIEDSIHDMNEKKISITQNSIRNEKGEFTSFRIAGDYNLTTDAIGINDTGIIVGNYYGYGYKTKVFIVDSKNILSPKEGPL